MDRSGGSRARQLTRDIYLISEKAPPWKTASSDRTESAEQDSNQPPIGFRKGLVTDLDQDARPPSQNEGAERNDPRKPAKSPPAAESPEESAPRPLAIWPSLDLARYNPGQAIKVTVTVRGGTPPFKFFGLAGVRWRGPVGRTSLTAPTEPGRYSLTLTATDSGSPPQRTTRVIAFEVTSTSSGGGQAKPPLSAGSDLSSVQAIVVYSASRRSDAAVVIDYLRRSKVKKIQPRDQGAAKGAAKGASIHRGKIYCTKKFISKAHLIAREIASAVKVKPAYFPPRAQVPDNLLVIWIVD